MGILRLFLVLRVCASFPTRSQNSGRRPLASNQSGKTLCNGDHHDSTLDLCSTVSSLHMTSRQRHDMQASRPLNLVSGTTANLDGNYTAGGADLSYHSALKALQSYHGEHGDLVMPRKFVIPYGSATFPTEWHGRCLPSEVYNMRWWLLHVKSQSDRVAELNELGFLWERMQPFFNLVIEALIAYCLRYGDILVPANFVVPHGDNDWPKATWKLPLGSCVYRIRTRHDFLRDNNAASRRAQLDGLGFVWDTSELKFHRFYSALKLYAALNKDERCSAGRTMPLRVPAKFVVPESSDWPQVLWGYRLGEKCSAVRSKELYVKGYEFRRRLLEDIGFHFDGNASIVWLNVVHAAAIYSKLHGRQLDVPIRFKVPAPTTEAERAEWPWPDHLWHLPLGERLKAVRKDNAYLHEREGPLRRRQLDALGFVWTPKRGRRPIET